MKSTGTIALAGLLAAAISTSSAAVAQSYFARVKVGEARSASSAGVPKAASWQHVIERIYDCRQKGGWLESQYLPACVASKAITTDGNCSGPKPAPIGDTTIVDPLAAGCPILTERNLI